MLTHFLALRIYSVTCILSQNKMFYRPELNLGNQELNPKSFSEVIVSKNANSILQMLPATPTLFQRIDESIHL